MLQDMLLQQKDDCMAPPKRKCHFCTYAVSCFTSQQMMQLHKTATCVGTPDSISLADVLTATSTSRVLKPWPVMTILGAVLMVPAAVGFSNAEVDLIGWLTGLAG